MIINLDELLQDDGFVSNLWYLTALDSATIISKNSDIINTDGDSIFFLCAEDAFCIIYQQEDEDLNFSIARLIFNTHKIEYRTLECINPNSKIKSSAVLNEYLYSLN